MQLTNHQWKENYQKIRNQILVKLLTLAGGIISLSIYVYQTIILKTTSGELLPSEAALMLLSVGILIAATVILYDAGMTISKTYRDEGMDIKVKGASDATLMLFYSKMDRCFKNIVRITSIVAILFAIMIYIALVHTYSFSTAVIFTGLYLIAVLMTFPNMCKVQARKKTFVERYHPKMNLQEMKDLVFEIAKTFKGEVVCSKTRKVEETNLAKRVAKAKKKFTRWMYTYILAYVFNAITYASISTSTLSLAGYFTVSTNSYYTILSLVIISFLFGQRYLYAHVTSGDALRRRRICRRILGESTKNAA
jgi:uncharacterized membrane protein YidH (DUF202 family)